MIFYPYSKQLGIFYMHYHITNMTTHSMAFGKLISCSGSTSWEHVSIEPFSRHDSTFGMWHVGPPFQTWFVSFIMFIHNINVSHSYQFHNNFQKNKHATCARLIKEFRTGTLFLDLYEVFNISIQYPPWPMQCISPCLLKTSICESGGHSESACSSSHCNYYICLLEFLFQ